MSRAPHVPLLPGLVATATVKCVVALAIPLVLTADVAASGDTPFPIAISYLHIVVFGLSGGWLILGSRTDSRGRYLGTLFLLIAAMFSARPLALGAAATGARWLHALRIIDPLPFTPWLLWSFAEHFPRDFLSQRRRRMASFVRHGCLIVASVLSLLSVFAAVVVFANGPDALPVFPPDWPIYWVFIIVLELAALVTIALKTRFGTRVERRRASLFVAGLLVGFGPMAADVLLELLIPPFGRFMSRPDIRWASGVVFYPLLLSVPLTTG